MSFNNRDRKISIPPITSRKLRTHLDLLVPDIAGRVRMRQNLQKHSHDLHAKDRQFQENNLVMAKNFGQGPPWITGKILKQSGAATFLVELPDGRVIRRHSNQLKANTLDPQESIEPHTDEQWLPETESNCQPQEPVPIGPRQSTRSRHPPLRFRPDSY